MAPTEGSSVNQSCNVLIFVSQQVYRPVLSFLRTLSMDGQHVAQLRNPHFNGLVSTLPESVHVMSLEPLPNRELLVRIEYLHSQGPPVTVDLTVRTLSATFALDISLKHMVNVFLSRSQRCRRLRYSCS